MNDTNEIDVLIVGAGPTGLVLALCLQRLGVRFRLIDKGLAPGETSRALVVHARTLEFYRQLGIANVIIHAAQKFLAVNLWVGGKVRGRLPFSDFGAGLSRFPYSLILPQDVHERLLAGELHERGIDIERGIEVTGVTCDAKSASTRLIHADGTEENCVSTYVAGCDGARSTVREKTGIKLPGGTYSNLWYVADVTATGPIVNHEVNISMDDRDVLAIFPMEGNNARLIGQAPPPADGGTVSWDDVSHRMIAELRTTVSKVKWFSTYRVHHRVAEHFRKGPVFLLGDAAHLHSPVGGQGMNTGIGDAVNLAWKIAQTVKGASTDLLDTYEPERIAFARGLVATTDRVFAVLDSKSAFSRLFRTVLAPTFLPLALRLPFGRRFAFGTLSQIGIEYRKSPLSRGHAGSVHAGDRLPWVATPRDPNGFEDNFAPLREMNWQLHVYGEIPTALKVACETHHLPAHVFAWRASMRRASLVRGACYLIRPDGHIAFAGTNGEAEALETYLRESPAFR